MNREVRKVRKAIMQRKRAREITTKNTSYSTKQVIPTLPSDEEKHGYYPNIFDGTSFSKQKSQFISSLVLKGTLSLILFFGVGILWQADSKMLENPKQWTSHALTEEFPFANVYKWYTETFGSPLAFSPTKISGDSQSLAFPVAGNVIESFQANGKGIMIAPEEATSVKALRDGIVIFSGNDRDTDRTVKVQHADGSESTYGNLSSIDVHLYQFIQSNQRIGTFNPSGESETVYFAIEKDREFIDPVQVIEVDDNP